MYASDLRNSKPHVYELKALSGSNKRSETVNMENGAGQRMHGQRTYGR
jgi:hypothetical protein